MYSIAHPTFSAYEASGTRSMEVGGVISKSEIHESLEHMRENISWMFSVLLRVTQAEAIYACRDVSLHLGADLE